MGLISRVSSRTYRERLRQGPPKKKISRLLQLNLKFVRHRLLSTTIPTKSSNFYQILGVNKSATNKEIKKAFRAKSLECHPDKFPDDKQKESQFKVLSEAYQTLSDTELRRKYDMGGTSSGRASAGPSGYNRSYSSQQRSQQK